MYSALSRGPGQPAHRSAGTVTWWRPLTGCRQAPTGSALESLAGVRSLVSMPNLRAGKAEGHSCRGQRGQLSREPQTPGRVCRPRPPGAGQGWTSHSGSDQGLGPASTLSTGLGPRRWCVLNQPTWEANVSDPQTASAPGPVCAATPSPHLAMTPQTLPLCGRRHRTATSPLPVCDGACVGVSQKTQGAEGIWLGAGGLRSALPDQLPADRQPGKQQVLPLVCGTMWETQLELLARTRGDHDARITSVRASEGSWG